MIKIWAYSFATLGFFVGVWLFKKEKWKAGAWIICCSLLIFLGGNIEIGQINPQITDSFNFIQRMNALEKELDNVQINLKQAISMKQEVQQTVNIITRVEKEIANMKEATKELYGMYSGELFQKKELGDKAQIFDYGTGRAVVLELSNIPIGKSVLITHRRGIVSPAACYIVNNTVLIRMEDALENIFNNDKEYFFVTYCKDLSSKSELLTVKDMKYEGTQENPNKAFYKKKLLENNKNL